MTTPVLTKLNENKEFLYAVLLILLIPAALIINTLILIQRVNNDFETEITGKANLATTILSASIKDIATNSASLNSHIKQISNNSSEVKGLTVLSFKQGNPIILATTEGEESLSTNNILQSKLAWTTGQPYTTKLDVLNENGKPGRLWQVSMPLRDKNENIAVVNLKISGAKSDDLVAKLQRDALFLSIGIVFILILLLLNHFRFFGYAKTFVKLKELDEMKDNFISLASHELRTPVTALRGFAALALKKLRAGDTRTALTDISMVDRAAESINNLVNDLLDVSRIEQGRLKIEFQNLDLSLTVSEVVRELAIQADQKGLALNYNPQPGLLISADPQKLKQVFVNLIGNAIKYTLHGQVVVSHEIEHDKIKTLIKDTGLGIPAEEVPNLFEKFHRIQNKQTQQIRGTGLGLWITKQLVELMKGKILVESIENVGTKIIVVFPKLNNKK